MLMRAPDALVRPGHHCCGSRPQLIMETLPIDTCQEQTKTVLREKLSATFKKKKELRSTFRVFTLGN